MHYETQKWPLKLERIGAWAFKLGALCYSPASDFFFLVKNNQFLTWKGWVLLSIGNKWIILIFFARNLVFIWWLELAIGQMWGSPDAKVRFSFHPSFGCYFLWTIEISRCFIAKVSCILSTLFAYFSSNFVLLELVCFQCESVEFTNFSCRTSNIIV